MTTTLRSLLCALAAAGLSLFASPSWSQVPIKPLETYNPIDANGVNLLDGSYSATTPTVSIGPKDGGLSYSQTYSSGQGWTESISSMVMWSGANWSTGPDPWYTVTLMGRSIAFKKTGSTFAPSEGDNASLVFDGSYYTLTLADGTVAVYGQIQGFNPGIALAAGSLAAIAYPNGRQVTFNYANLAPSAYRVQSVTSNDGYQLHFDYASNSYDGTQGGLWRKVSKVTALNNAVDACDPLALTCTYSRTWPSLSFGGNASDYQVTDALARTSHYFFTNGILTGVRRPGRVSGQDLTIFYDTEQMVQMVTTDSGNWTYAIPDAYKNGFPSAPLQTIIDSAVQVTDPLNHTRIVTHRSRLVDIPTRHRVTRLRATVNALGKGTLYGYNSDFRLASIQQPEGNSVAATFDTRGNITKLTRNGKTGSGLSQITAEATYPSSCTDPGITAKTCNQPTTVTGANGAVTTFAYDTNHGGVTSVTSPPPTSGAVQPQVRTSYAAYSAWYKNAAGTIVQSPTAIWLPTGTSQCASTASCAGAADESKTSTTYQAGSAGLASNLLPTATTRTDGIASLTATTSYTYEPTGRVSTVDGPLAGGSDVTRTYYDVMLQPTVVIGPDPDGLGPLLYGATRTTYTPDGQPADVEAGTATGQADNSPSSFVSLQDVRTEYDVSGRKSADKLITGGVVRTLTQYGYDAANRPTCTTVRLNPATFASPPAACVAGVAGADGPDRITYTQYDDADQVTQVTSGYGLNPALNASRIEKVVTYTDNGKVKTLADGNTNLTTLEYDTYDRLVKTRYPNPSGGGSSTTDYEQLAYDAADNIVTRIKRRPAGSSGSTVTYVYDALNRQTYRSDPQGYSYYDNLDRRTYTYAGASNEKVNIVYYDGLGNPRTTYDWTGAAWRRTTNEYYDLAGRRTILQWADDAYVIFSRDNLGRIGTIYENGATTILSSHYYNNLGLRTGVYRLNGAQTYYGYDVADRLSALSLDLPNPAQDQIYSLTYNAAGQVKTRTLANTSGGYLWTPTLGSRGYTANGLNQYTAVGGASFGYDARGNLQSTGTTSYGYDLDNRLVWRPGATAVALGYDPLGRLDTQVVAIGGGSTTTRLFYVGADLIEETDASFNTTRRYVPGDGPDEPLVWYEGSGLADRRFLQADDHGSVVAVTNSAGVATTINAYDEYGVPAASNAGRFQYTGQVWLPEMGVYHYKARAYSPTLGRFLQTDPSGYDDGLNWYAYVHNDPLNNGDPDGKQAIEEIILGVIHGADKTLALSGGMNMTALAGGNVSAGVYAGSGPGGDMRVGVFVSPGVSTGGDISGGATATVYNGNTSNVAGASQQIQVGGGPLAKVSVAAGETMPKFDSPALAEKGEQRTSFVSASVGVGTPWNATYSRNITAAGDISMPMTPTMKVSSDVTRAIIKLFKGVR